MDLKDCSEFFLILEMDSQDPPDPFEHCPGTILRDIGKHVTILDNPYDPQKSIYRSEKD